MSRIRKEESQRKRRSYVSGSRVWTPTYCSTCMSVVLCLPRIAMGSLLAFERYRNGSSYFPTLSDPEDEHQVRSLRPLSSASAESLRLQSEHRSRSLPPSDSG
jgi:hypothetical protein